MPGAPCTADISVANSTTCIAPSVLNHRESSSWSSQRIAQDGSEETASEEIAAKADSWMASGTTDKGRRSAHGYFAEEYITAW